MRSLMGLKNRIAGILLPLVLAATMQGQNSRDLESGFATPPNSAKPRVWWHWMNGNITKEGIKLDLEWMHRVGIGGFQNFDAALGTPQVVDNRLIVHDAGMERRFLYATKLADQLGWKRRLPVRRVGARSGGPWVKPSRGNEEVCMERNDMSTVAKPFSGMLTHPPSNTGAFQNMGVLIFLP